jgi:hypothetical protein
MVLRHGSRGVLSVGGERWKTGLGGKWGGNTEHALNKWFCAPNFLEIADVGEASLYF